MEIIIRIQIIQKYIAISRIMDLCFVFLLYRNRGKFFKVYDYEKITKIIRQTIVRSMWRYSQLFGRRSYISQGALGCLNIIFKRLPWCYDIFGFSYLHAESARADRREDMKCKKKTGQFLSCFFEIGNSLCVVLILYCRYVYMFLPEIMNLQHYILSMFLLSYYCYRNHQQLKKQHFSGMKCFFALDIFLDKQFFVNFALHYEVIIHNLQMLFRPLN